MNDTRQNKQKSLDSLHDIQGLGVLRQILQRFLAEYHLVLGVGINPARWEQTADVRTVEYIIRHTHGVSIEIKHDRARLLVAVSPRLDATADHISCFPTWPLAWSVRFSVTHRGVNFSERMWQ